VQVVGPGLQSEMQIRIEQTVILIFSEVNLKSFAVRNRVHMCWVIIIAPPISNSKVLIGSSSVSHLKRWLIAARALRTLLTCFQLFSSCSLIVSWLLTAQTTWHCVVQFHLPRIKQMYWTAYHSVITMCESLQALFWRCWHAQIIVCVGDTAILANLFSIWMSSASLVQHHFANSAQKISAAFNNLPRWWPQKSYIYFKI